MKPTSVNLFDAESADQFELRLFCQARYYTVAYRLPGQRRFTVDEYKDFAAAALAADQTPRAILYAVGPYDVARPLVRARWPEYLRCWRIRLGLDRYTR
jgi:hypothetical protein